MTLERKWMHPQALDYSRFRFLAAATAATTTLAAALASTRYDPALARLYMWAQSRSHVMLACYLPNGRHDREVVAEVAGGVLQLGVAGGPPVVRRALSGPLEPGAPVEVHRTADGCLALLLLTKAGADAAEGAVAFAGDGDGVRAVPPPYSLSQQQPDEVVVELELPWWVRAEDVAVEVGGRRLAVAVRGLELRLARHYSLDGPEHAAVVPELSSWSLADQGGAPHHPKPAADAACGAGVGPPAQVAAVGAARGGGRMGGPGGSRRPGRCLAITLARPGLTDEERAYKKAGKKKSGVGSAASPSARPTTGREQHRAALLRTFSTLPSAAEPGALQRLLRLAPRASSRASAVVSLLTSDSAARRSSSRMLPTSPSSTPRCSACSRSGSRPRPAAASRALRPGGRGQGGAAVAEPHDGAGRADLAEGLGDHLVRVVQDVVQRPRHSAGILMQARRVHLQTCAQQER
ncbi:hypothetical protein TSOC_005293 [Tetrabaena socialis]|uniref:CS domain-containing protein n=1 Tax=Tetrabaena socialis TaxID=47790 RepID=A0A2J8A6T1_9CHLO|nr:hypothetical protein TSOC_005293 [Tetrabaena socialis]|eukprot:PNH08207.1 hypothetical protein TSOC_005293 [Tetrabaena socialis]